MAAQGDPNFDSNDPYEVLGFRVPTSDAKEIKRAYRNLALRYHPDVAVASGKDKGDEKALEMAKKRASDRFAKINWAYQVLSGKESATTSQPTGTKSSSSSAGGGGWTPPHRRPSSAAGASSSRTSASSSASSPGSTDDWWRDYVPGYDGDSSSYEYDAGGDSLGAIFRDLVTGAASGGRGVLKDFVEFLEQNVDGYSAGSGGSDDDAELRVLLRIGSLADIGDEMDTTELVMRQLAEKQRQLDEELVLVTAESKIASKYMEKLELDERAQEVKARKKVVESYVGKARKRLLALQTRYKQLIVSGENDPKAGGRSAARGPYSASSPWTENRSPSSSTSSSSGRQYSASTSSTSSKSQRPRHEKADDAWKDDSFGSFGRGRGSSRRRSQQQAPTSSSSDRSSYSRSPSSSHGSGAGRAASRAPSPPRAQPVPPRLGAPTYEQQMEDKRRLRDLKVDEEFDKLKKDLGL
jgi:DnaJ-domain-containing protein 1